MLRLQSGLDRFCRFAILTPPSRRSPRRSLRQTVRWAPLESALTPQKEIAMKWTAAFIAFACALAGCSSGQPSTNPFLRTTVPPPGTGQGAVVVPGEPYTPGVGAPAPLG